MFAPAWSVNDFKLCRLEVNCWPDCPVRPTSLIWLKACWNVLLAALMAEEVNAAPCPWLDAILEPAFHVKPGARGSITSYPCIDAILEPAFHVPSRKLLESMAPPPLNPWPVLVSAVRFTSPNDDFPLFGASHTFGVRWLESTGAGGVTPFIAFIIG